MENMLEHYINYLTAPIVIQKLIESEIRIAHLIQMSKLPDGSEQLFKESGESPAAKLFPAEPRDAV
jgi:hypothetical protein